MLILGVVLLLIGVFAAVPILITIGIILLAVGVLLLLVPGITGGRRFY